MWAEFVSFLWWYVLLPWLFLNLLFLLFGTSNSIWQSPQWVANANRRQLLEAADPLDDANDSKAVADARPKCSSKHGGTSDLAAEAAAGAAPLAPSDTSPSELSSEGLRIRKMMGSRLPLSKHQRTPAKQNETEFSEPWGRNRWRVSRVRSYLAMRIVSLLLPFAWLINAFFVQQLLRRLLLRFQIQQQKQPPISTELRSFGVSDLVFVAYSLYFIWCVFAAERFGFPLGRPVLWVRRWSLWRHAAEYFPISVIEESKGVKYQHDKSYLIGFHPHGVLSLSCSLPWGSDSDWPWLSIRRIFPRIELRLTTLAINMRLPFWRHLLQAFGFMSCNKQNIMGFLSKDSGRAVVVVVGGAKEALLGGNGRNDLVLHRRRGFFEIALQSGAWLIPVFSLGENEAYERPQDDFYVAKMLNSLSRKTMEILGFSVPFCYGRGLFQLAMPKRVKILTVVGDPIPVDRNPHPTVKDINEIRTRYCEALERVYNKARIAYGPEGHFKALRIVE